MGSGASIAAGFAIFLAFLALIAVGILFYQERFRPTVITYSIQNGVVGGTDTFNPATNIYIANQAITAPLALTIAGDPAFFQGRVIYVKNASTQVVTLVPTAGLAINTGGIANGLTVTTGQTAWLLFTTPNVAIRLM